jgi:hypothetical protein
MFGPAFDCRLLARATRMQSASAVAIEQTDDQAEGLLSGLAANR